MFAAVRVFDPNYAASHATPAHVQALSTVQPIAARGLSDRLVQELPHYLALCAAAPTLDHSSVHDYTLALLLWWRNNHPRVPAWAWLWSRFPEIRSEICDARKKTVSGNFQGNL